MNPFARRDNQHQLAVGMTGVKMGDRLLEVGCADGGRLAAIAAKVGLSGRAVAVVPDEAAAARLRKGAAREGVLVEVEVAPASSIPAGEADFDVAIVDDTRDFAGAMGEADRAALIRELLRVLRPGGRAIFMGSMTPTSGLGALLAANRGGLFFVATGGASDALSAGGLTSVRTLADHEGLVFVEGIKPRAARKPD